MVDATRVKICGLKTKKHVDAAAAAEKAGIERFVMVSTIGTGETNAAVP